MILTTLCYIEHEDHVLLLHRTRKEDDINEGKWIGVGGKFLDRESPEDCLLREVREETGYGLSSWRFRGIITFLQDGYETEYMCLYTADDFLVPSDGEFVGVASEKETITDAEATGSAGGASGESRLFSHIPVALHPGFRGKKASEWPLPDCSEGELAWIARDEMSELPMWEGDRVFLGLIEEDRPFFSLRLEYSGEELVSIRLDGKEIVR